MANLLVGLRDWVDARLPINRAWDTHMGGYYAPKNFNFWYFFGVLSLLVLVNQLLPTMLAAGAGRIVHVGSRSGYLQAPPGGIDFDNLRGEGEFDAGQAYGRSKLANALFSLALAERLEGTGVTSNVVHPGLVNTNIARTAPLVLRKAFDLVGPLFAKTAAEGAATQVYVATNPLLDGVNGAYFVDCNPVVVSGGVHQVLSRVQMGRNRGMVHSS